MNTTELEHASPGARLVLALATGVLAAAMLWISGAEVAGWFSDAVDYLAIADHFREQFGLGAGIAEAADVFRGSRFPPLYPLTLALGGAGTAAQAPAFVITSATYFLAAIVTWWWYRRAIGRGTEAALLGAALMLSVGTWTWPADLVSEPLFLLLLGTAFALAERPDPRRVIAFAVCVGLLPLVRAVGAIAVVAAVPFLLGQKHLPVPRRMVGIAVALLPGLLWSAYRASIGASGYAGTISLARIEAAFDGYAGLLTTQPVRLVQAFAHNIDPQLGFAAFALSLVLLASAVVGLMLRLRRNRFDAWFLPPYLGLVWVWPYLAETERLVFVALPALLLYAFEGGRALLARVDLRAPGAAIAGTVLAGVVLAGGTTALRMTQHALRDVDPELAPYKRRMSYLLAADTPTADVQLESYARLIGVMRAATAELPPDACFYAENAGLAWLQSRRDTVSYPTGFDPARSIDSQLPACDYFLVSEFSTKQHQLSGRELMRSVVGFTEPVLASTIERAGADPRLVVALMRRRPAP